MRIAKGNLPVGMPGVGRQRSVLQEPVVSVVFVRRRISTGVGCQRCQFQASGFRQLSVCFDRRRIVFVRATFSVGDRRWSMAGRRFHRNGRLIRPSVDERRRSRGGDE